MVGEDDEPGRVVQLLHLNDLQIRHRHVVREDLNFLYHDRLRGVTGVQRILVRGRHELDHLSPGRADVHDVMSLTGRRAESGMEHYLLHFYVVLGVPLGLRIHQA